MKLAAIFEEIETAIGALDGKRIYRAPADFGNLIHRAVKLGFKLDDGSKGNAVDFDLGLTDGYIQLDLCLTRKAGASTWDLTAMMWAGDELIVMIDREFNAGAIAVPA